MKKFLQNAIESCDGFSEDYVIKLKNDLTKTLENYEKRYENESYVPDYPLDHSIECSCGDRDCPGTYLKKGRTIKSTLSEGEQGEWQELVDKLDRWGKDQNIVS